MTDFSSPRKATHIRSESSSSTNERERKRERKTEYKHLSIHFEWDTSLIVESFKSCMVLVTLVAFERFGLNNKSTNPGE